MRLVIKEYIAQLREKDELDILLCDLLTQQGYILDSRPKTGNRQYGVDIHAYTDNENLLFVVKQGDISRAIWDGNQNAVRPSINEIRDVYFRNMTAGEKKKTTHIIVATNGLLDESVKQNWNGFIDDNVQWGQTKIEIDFWGIDKIVDLIQTEFLNEHVFGKNLQSLMRKALYFVGEADYKREYYEVIVNHLIANALDVHDKRKRFHKAMTTLYLATQMICQYAHNAGMNKVAIMVSEYLIIKYWNFIFDKKLFEQDFFVEWLLKFEDCYEKWSECYYQNVKSICSSPGSFPYYNRVESKVMLYEVVGYLVTYAHYLQAHRKKHVHNVMNSIIDIINNYDYFFFAPYDIHINVIIAVYRMLAKLDRYDEIKAILREQSSLLMLNYKLNGKYPAPSDTFDEAVEIEFNTVKFPYKTSIFWGNILFCIAQLNDETQYDNLYSFLTVDLGEVTKCTWLLRKEDERALYGYGATSTAGEGFVVSVKEDFSEFKKDIKLVLDECNEEMSWDTYSAESIEFIICRYFDYIPRITKELECEKNSEE